MKKKIKRIKVLCLVNTLTVVNQSVYASHTAMFTHTVRVRPEIDVLFFTPARMSIDRARNEAAKIAMREECDFLMFLDDDVLVDKQALIDLIDADQDIIAGTTIIRGWPFNIMAFKYGKPKSPQHAVLGFFNQNLWKKDKKGKYLKLQYCDAIGFSLALIKVDILLAMHPPYFVTSATQTEDVYFCVKATNILDPAPKILLHTGVITGHLMPQEPVSLYNLKAMKAYHKTFMHLSTGGPLPVRDKDYIKMCLVSLGVK